MAEFIDNSIQATNSISKRKVCISFYFDTLKPESWCKFISITDNGTGMDIKGIKDFATYSLDAKTRKKELKSGKSMISKFGVGAKNAGTPRK